MISPLGSICMLGTFRLSANLSSSNSHGLYKPKGPIQKLNIISSARRRFKGLDHEESREDCFCLKWVNNSLKCGWGSLAGKSPLSHHCQKADSIIISYSDTGNFGPRQRLWVIKIPASHRYCLFHISILQGLLTFFSFFDVFPKNLGKDELPVLNMFLIRWS